MDMIINYVKPELVVVAIALYFVGAGLKKTEKVKDKYIPLVLGVVGIVLALIYVLATSELDSMQNVLMAMFTAIIQGILTAGLSNYANQLIKQTGKDE